MVVVVVVVVVRALEDTEREAPAAAGACDLWRGPPKPDAWLSRRANDTRDVFVNMVGCVGGLGQRAAIIIKFMAFKVGTSSVEDLLRSSGQEFSLEDTGALPTSICLSSPLRHFVKDAFETTKDHKKESVTY